MNGLSGVEPPDDFQPTCSFLGCRENPDSYQWIDSLFFGLFAVSAMLIFYALENRSRWFILAFGGSCVFASIYGFLQGAWPFGMVEGIWSLVAVHRWWNTLGRN